MPATPGVSKQELHVEYIGIQVVACLVLLLAPAAQPAPAPAPFFGLLGTFSLTVSGLPHSTPSITLEQLTVLLAGQVVHLFHSPLAGQKKPESDGYGEEKDCGCRCRDGYDRMDELMERKGKKCRKRKKCKAET